MASTWGSSWSTSWGSSWDFPVVQPSATDRDVYATPSHRLVTAQPRDTTAPSRVVQATPARRVVTT